MDEQPGKRHVGGVGILRKGYTLHPRDVANNRNEEPQFCNRVGCSGRLKYSRNARVSFNEKPQHSKCSFPSPNGKEIIGSSSRTSGIPIVKKSGQDSQRKFSSDLENDSSESSSIHDESDVSEHICSPSREAIGLHSGMRESRSDSVTLTGVRKNSSLVSDSKSVRVFRQKPRSFSQNALPGASIPTSSSSSSLGARSNSSGGRYGLRNLKFKSTSDIIPRTGSSSESKIGGKDELKKRSPEEESSSSSQGKRSSGTTSEAGRISFSTNGISISSSRQMRNWSSGSNANATSARTHRPMNSSTRMRFSINDHPNHTLLFTDSTAIIPQLPGPDTPANSGINSSSYQSSSESSSNYLSCNICDINDRNTPRMMPFTSIEHGVTHALRRYNLDEVAEMLIDLERIEQDEELTYERLLALETNLFLGSLNLYDQHRDMRLDIDNMSYEELLALEERMGTVSTALSEESLEKCLKISIYQTPSLEVGSRGCGDDEDDIKCTICQEEYEVGDEIGKLECDHECHAGCIQQWLRVKNWCPICKVSAAPPTSNSS